MEVKFSGLAGLRAAKAPKVRSGSGGKKASLLLDLLFTGGKSFVSKRRI